jgi:hypothetical protein
MDNGPITVNEPANGSKKRSSTGNLEATRSGEGSNGGVLVCGWVKLLSGEGCGEEGGLGRGAQVVNLWAEMDAFQVLLYPRVDEEDEGAGGSGHRLLAMPLVRLAMSEVLALTPLPVSEYRDQVFEMHVRQLRDTNILRLPSYRRADVWYVWCGGCGRRWAGGCIGCVC